MKRLFFFQLRLTASVLLLIAVTLVFWRGYRQTELKRRMAISSFKAHHFYKLNVDNKEVCHFRTLSEGLLFVHHDSARIDSLHRMFQAQQTELNYYLRVHNVTDEGYNMIADHAQQVDMETDSLEALLNVIGLIGKGHPWQIVHEVSYSLQAHQKTPHDVRGDSLGIYKGEMDSLRRPHGHGIYKAYDGSYYQGAWHEGQRHGFGFATTPWQRLRVGEWANDRYLGERMHYTSERIYGIDISRYQHEQGKKKFDINWNLMRITHLGTISKKHISGTVDYPVRFVYIKSTEGTTVKNKYYKTDYLNARKHGIRTGSYHFFSVRTTGADQANYFLKNSCFRQGDLPPVLDVEPTAAQIRDMGGTPALFARIRSWMNIVERHCGVKPVLYVSQSFVDRYLGDAPDLKKDYKVWIARYGEYKPDVHLAIWQLCPDGRVSGIKVPVDINVFDGYGEEYKEFLENNAIR